MSDFQNPQPAPGPQSAAAPPPPIDYATAGGTPVAATPDDRTWGMLCHLLAFAGYLIPFGHIIGPLVIWLLKKEQSPFVDDQGKESINFQITMTIAVAVVVALMFVLIGFVLMPIVVVADIVLVIVATVKANQGIAYRYPFCLRLIK